MYDKEDVYDKEIAPLLKSIIEICKRESLPMVAQFYIKEEREDTGEPMYSSTVIIPAPKEMNKDAYLQIKSVSAAMKYGPSEKPFVMATTIRASN